MMLLARRAALLPLLAAITPRRIVAIVVVRNMTTYNNVIVEGEGSNLAGSRVAPHNLSLSLVC